MSPRAQYTFSYRYFALHSDRLSEVTTKRGLASPAVNSALATTRRWRLQLSSVVHRKSLKQRAGLPVRRLLASALAISPEILAINRVFLANPKRKCTPFASHQAINSSRAKPLSARTRMRTLGQRSRMWATMRATSSKAPSAAHVQRQVAIAVVIAVKEPPFLLPVHWIVRRIKIQDDFTRWTLVRFQKYIDEKTSDRHRIVTDLVITRRLQL